MQPIEMTGAQAGPGDAFEMVQAWGQVGFWELDLETMDAYWSTQAFEISGLDSVSLGGFLDGVHADDRALVHQVASRARQQPGPYRVEHRYRRCDEDRVLSHRIQSIPGPAGTPTRVLGVVTDVTDVRRLQAQVEAAVSIRNVGLVASSLVHNFKNQLAIVLGHAQLALDAVERGDLPMRESLEAIQRAATQGIDTTRQVLDLGRVPLTAAGRVDPGVVLERVAALAVPVVGSENRVVVHSDGGETPVLADGDRLEQVMVDFVINAADALPASGGSVTLSYREQDVEAADAGARGLDPGRYGVFSVSDDGCGMDAQTAARASEPFFTTKERGHGSGVGLSTAASFAQALGGGFSIESQPDVGTTVALFVPLASAEPDLRRRRPPRRVVVQVDDETTQQRLATRLADAGVQVVLAAGWPATDAFLRTEPIDAVVADAPPPEGEPTAGVPVVLVPSAPGGEDDVLEALDRLSSSPPVDHARSLTSH